MNWGELKALVLGLMTDTAPAEASARLFVEAIARYVRARAVLEIAGRGAEALALSKTHENEFRRLRRRLAGRLCPLDDATLLVRVRERLIETKVDDAMAVNAVAEYVKSKLALKVDEEPDLAAAYAANWVSLRLRMLGHTLALERAVLRQRVREYLADDAARLSEGDSLDALIDAHCDRAADELEALKAWVDGVILSGREEFEALKGRVDHEILNGAIELQTHIVPLRAGNFSRYTAAEVLTEGYASRGKMPEGARPVAAWIEYPAADDEPDSEDGQPEGCAKVPCMQVPWHREQELKCTPSCEPRLCFQRTSRCFVVSPALVAGEVELLLQWEGVKQSYLDADDTTFDRQCAQALAAYVQWKLAVIDDDARAAAAGASEFVRMRRSVWIETREARELAFVQDDE